MRYLVAAVVLVPLAVLQSSVFSRISVFGGAPNLVVLSVLIWAIVRGSLEGVFCGFVGGLFYDFANGGPIGISALALVTVAAIVGAGGRAVFRSNLLLPLILVFAATMLYVLISGFLLATLHYPTDWRTAVVDVAIPSAIANALFALLIYPLLSAIDGRTGGRTPLAV